MPTTHTPGRALGACYLRAMLAGDADALDHYSATYATVELLDAVSRQAVTLALRVATLGAEPVELMADRMVAAASLRDSVGA